MPRAISITIQTTADLKGVQAVQKALADLAKSSSGTQAGGGGAANAFNAQAKAANQAAIASAKLATANAQAAASSSRAASAAQGVATASSNAAAAQTRAEQAALRLAQAQARAAQPAQTLTSLFGQLSGQLSGVGGSVGSLAGSIGTLTGAMGTLGTVGAAIGIGKVAIDLAVVGANADLVKQRFDGLAAAAGTTGEALLGALRSASGGEISDLNLQLAANKAQLLGVADSAEEFGVLMSIARDRAQQMGISTTQAFNDLVTGLGRGSALILDNLGITISVTEANEAYAASIGKTATQLTEAESKTALVNAVLAQGKASLDATGGAIESNAGSFARFSTVVDNAKNSLGNAIATGLEPYARSVADASDATQGFLTWLGNIGTVTPEAAAATAAYTAEMERSGSVALANAAYEAALTSARAQTTAATAAAVPVIASSTAAQLANANSMELAGIQARAAAQAAEMKSNADKVAAVDAQTHAIAQDKLTTAAMDAARALLAAGGQGAATANTLAGSSQQVDVLTAAYYRLFAAQQAVGVAAAKAKARTDDFAERHGGDTGRALTPAAQKRAADTQRLNDQIAANKKANDIKAAKDEIALANGTAAEKNKIFTDQYNQAVARYGAESVEAIKAQGKLIQATQAGAKAAGGAKVSAAEQAGLKLEGIEQKTGDKLSQIVADTQAKLIAIDQKAADERAKIAADLANKIATSAADRRAANEADDLDLIGVDDALAAAKLNDRERAQAAAREREVAAAKEAQDAIANGEAESASKVYDIREKQISDQQALDEKYAERQRELSGDEKNLDALKTQYDEATRANEEAAQRRIDIAKAEAEQKKSEVQAEKDAVIAAANDQANQVVSAAERSAAGVTKATSAARASSVANLKAIGDAVTAIPSQKTITITVNQQGTVGASSGGGGGGGTRAAGGGTFVTSGKTNLTVGDNPGGRELVTVIPLSGKGQTRVGNGMIAMAGGGVIDAGGGYTTPIAGSPPAKPGKGKGKAGVPAPASAEAVRKAIKESIEIITLQNDLRKVQAEAARLRPAPINYAWIEGLATESQEIARIVTSKLLPLKKDEAEAFSKYASATGQAADILKTIADLRTMQAEAKIARPGPIIEGYIVGLANEAKTITQIVRDRLLPGTELEAELYSAYADAVGSSVSILKDIADLRTMQAKAKEERPGPIIEAYITELADEAVRISKIVSARAVPAAEEERDKISAFADIVGNSVSILKDVSSITRDMFADYASPTDEQLGRLVTDADRVAQAMTAAAARYDTKGLEAAKAYTDALGGTFGVIKDGLLAFEAINSGDFVLDKGKLDQFSTASMQALDVTRALAAKAAAIPAGDLSALQTATAAISAQAETMIKLAAVPWGDLAGANQNYAQSGGAMGGMNTTIYNTFNLPAGSTQQTVDLVIRQLNTQMGARR